MQKNNRLKSQYSREIADEVHSYGVFLKQRLRRDVRKMQRHKLRVSH